MTICIAGKNKIAIDAVQYLLTTYSSFKIVGCKNSTDDGIDSWQPSFQVFCQNNAIPLVSLADLYDVEELLVISLEYNKLIKPEKFKTKRLFNIHFSKLPAYKGMFTSIMPLLYGEQESGVTLHYIDKGIDTGAIVDQLAFRLSINTTSRDLYQLYLEHSFLLFKKNIDALIQNQIQATMQPAIGSSYYSKAALNFSAITVDLNKTAYEIHNQIRAFAFRDYQLPKVFDTAIYKAEMLPALSVDKPGTIVTQNEWHLIINSIDYQVMLYIDKEQDLMKAAANGDIDLFQNIKASDFPVTVKTKQGWDAMIVACYHNKTEFVKFLLDQGWDSNTTNYKGTTALMYAMTSAGNCGNMDTLNLLAPVVDWNKKDSKGNDIFFYAEQYGHPGVVNFVNRFKQN